jgi:hypothetical protein
MDNLMQNSENKEEIFKAITNKNYIAKLIGKYLLSSKVFLLSFFYVFFSKNFSFSLVFILLMLSSLLTRHTK